MQYEKQVRELGKRHRKAHDTGSSEEYLSGMKKEDRLIPVITLVIQALIPKATDARQISVANRRAGVYHKAKITCAEDVWQRID